jgi:signal transduction histidine kinase
MVSSRRLKHTLLSTMPAARIDPDGIAPDARFTAEVDNAVYFCCLEAMQNCAKYAPARRFTSRSARLTSIG